MNKMQKIVCVIMVVAVLAAMCVTVFAAYSLCPSCGRMALRTTSTSTTSSKRCLINPSYMDTLITTKEYEVCDECGYRELVSSYTERICNHGDPTQETEITD